MFIIEATWIGFIGALLGSVLAFLAGTALNPWISGLLQFGEERLLVFNIVQILILIIFLMAVAGLLPARKAAKLDPIEALRTE